MESDRYGLPLPICICRRHGSPENYVQVPSVDLTSDEQGDQRRRNVVEGGVVNLKVWMRCAHRVVHIKLKPRFSIQAGATICARERGVTP